MTGKKALGIMSFATVVSDKKLRDMGLTKGDEVLLISFKQTTPDPNNPYIKQEYALVAMCRDGLVQLPKEDNDYKVYLVNPNSLEGVSSDRKKELQKALREQYS